MRRRAAAPLCAVAAALALAAPAAAAPRLEKVGDFTDPVHVGAAPGDPRLFVVEQAGVVRVVADGAVRSEPFADLRDITLSGGEQGLLSIAFPPDHATSRLFYVYLTAREPTGQLQVRELRRSADPDKAEPGPGRLVLAQDHAEHGNHNGGQLQFGADGMLWIGTGDGGGGNDPFDAGQRRNTLLGKILRIDPRAAGAAPYTVPSDNPFVAEPGARGEVWAYGLRNPWRFSFDRGTGDLAIGDVGQSTVEEIDFAPAADGRGRGANYGWRCYEGSARTPGIAPTCSAPGHVPPVLEHRHDAGFASITGGYVVRDPGLPTLAGRYVYGDMAQEHLRSAVLAPGGAREDRAENALPARTVSSFGEDACGRLHVVSYEGPVYRLVDGEPTPCGPGASAPAPAAGPGAAAGTTGDRCRPVVSAPRRRLRATVLRRGLAVRVRAQGSCIVRISARARGHGAFLSVRRAMRNGERATLRLWPGRRAARALRRSRAVTVRVRVTASGTAAIERAVRLR